MKLEDLFARALYSEYRDADVGHSWFALPDDEKVRWRRVADYVVRMDEAALEVPFS